MKPVASTQEILETLTTILRGDPEDVSMRERMRAAELLGKRFGLFDGETEELSGPVIIEGVVE
jgi:hypothetical protein